MTEKQFTELTKRAFDLGFRQGYEIANRTPIDENTGKDEFTKIVLETAINSLESTVFESISAELDLMNEKFLAFDGWKVFSDGVIHGAGENFSDRTGNEE
jgi:regulator of RNase E activity RraB